MQTFQIKIHVCMWLNALTIPRIKIPASIYIVSTNVNYIQCVNEMLKDLGTETKSKLFLALLCATAQQSYCRHAGVRRPSSSVRRP